MPVSITVDGRLVYCLLMDVRCHYDERSDYIFYGGPCPGGLVKFAPIEARQMHCYTGGCYSEISLLKL